MPQHKSAVKRVRQSERRRVRNMAKQSRMKTAIKRILGAENKDVATKELTNTISILDRMALKGLIHRNKAANLKSQLTTRVNAMS
ncbi:30S ribosomal protein S20 [bacterium]|nr:30S ribosomal protein S20 [bacterium]